MKRLIRSCRSLSASIDMSDLKVLPDEVEEYGGYTIREKDGKFSIWIDHEYYGDARNLDDAELIVDCLNDDTKITASRETKKSKSNPSLDRIEQLADSYERGSMMRDDSEVEIDLIGDAYWICDYSESRGDSEQIKMACYEDEVSSDDVRKLCNKHGWSYCF